MRLPSLFARLLKSGANLIFIDEPTNDLDVNSIRALEGLEGFASCAVMVSHHRWFLDIFSGQLGGGRAQNVLLTWIRRWSGERLHLAGCLRRPADGLSEQSVERDAQRGTRETAETWLCSSFQLCDLRFDLGVFAIKPESLGGLVLGFLPRKARRWTLSCPTLPRAYRRK